MKQKGFTLIELLVVIGIIAILASVVIVALGGEPESGTQGKSSKEIKREMMQKAISSCIGQSGVPILDSWGDMTNCIFKPL